MNVIWLGVLGSLIAGALTAIGAVGVFFIRRLSQRLEDGLLSFAAGIMLAASFFSLILPGIEYGEKFFDNTYIAVGLVIAGVITGAVGLSLMNEVLPHEHFRLGTQGPDTETLSRIWLFIIAITIHNFPEGMAVGVGFAGGDIANGTTLATGIGIQNIPEGLAVSVSMFAVGYSRVKSFLVGSLTGLAEPIGGLIGSVAVSFSGPVLPFSLAFAAGAMLYIISHEIIPETHRSRFANVATFSLLIGFVFMMFLDATLG
ncbi:MAG: ZIP family metal transporter [Acidobacteria bacterium]|nr:MAG: ZIP family metal transporter [Acidobacteriota bacterium]REK04118.1 MAG: ZIP family metal transporter [Acidobacteriota bacterium]REK15280.1 MAG: ZIP family metal transporter [Acidobacteriota bacterium]REK46370.1 MAG: ZIP family metal transporter [Acidobacteriota bacterium]